jgi:putative endonuclease
MEQPAIYIVANRRNGTIYTGVTSKLVQRVAKHKSGDIPGFTAKHGCKHLVWFEIYDDMSTAIAREKQIKAGCRNRKLALIEATNPAWRDRYSELF